MPTQEQKRAYDNLMRIFDAAELAVDELEKLGEAANDVIPHVNDILERVEKNTEIFIECFVKVVKSGKVPSGVEKQKMEKARREFNNALDEYFKTYCKEGE